MKEYHKIETLYDRDEKTHKVIVGKWRIPEFGYLYNNSWLFTEKVDGTNVRVMWDGDVLRFGGRTDNAQMPVPLLAELNSMFTPGQMAAVFPDASVLSPVCLYGEGYGKGIQKGGGNYKPDGVGFALFDVRVGNWWLKWADVQDVGNKLTITCVPVLGSGSLLDATGVVQAGIQSHWGSFPAEGLVLRPQVDLFTRQGERVIGKLKTRDF